MSSKTVKTVVEKELTPIEKLAEELHDQFCNNHDGDKFCKCTKDSFDWPKWISRAKSIVTSAKNLGLLEED